MFSCLADSFTLKKEVILYCEASVHTPRYIPEDGDIYGNLKYFNIGSVWDAIV
jgi:hypothetical protein